MFRFVCKQFTPARQMSGWTRPDRIAWPKIWLRDKGFVVRDVTPDIEPYVLELKVANFTRDEPMNKKLRLYEDPQAVADLVRLFSEDLLPQRVSLVTLKEGTPGADLKPVGAANPPQVLGANILGVVHKNDPPHPALEDTCKSEIAKNVLRTVESTAKMVDIFKKFNIDHYMEVCTLSVCPSMRGQNLGFLMMQARLIMCKEMGIPLIETVLTNITSQKIAAKSGFQILAERSYDEIRGRNGELLFTDMAPTKVIQLGARLVS